MFAQDEDVFESNVFRRKNFNGKVFDSLIRDINFQIENNLRSTIVVPDWRSFKKYAKASSCDFYEDDRKNKVGAYCIELEDSEEPFYVRQTRFSSAYEFGDIILGYGFEDFQCLECNSDELFYDSIKDVYYCPACERR